jgi:hypothetical protein
MKFSVNKTKLLNGVSASVGLGFAIIPVEQGGKKPAISGWPKRATKDRKVARRYFARHPDMNYGIVTGGASRIFVIDVDGIEGNVRLAGQEALHGKLPRTVKVKTPHGEHYYFRTGDAVIPNSVGKITTGIDIRGDGGYVVGPGSRTLDGVYAFARGCGPQDLPIAEPPRWLFARLQEKGHEVSSEPRLTAQIPLQLRRRAHQWAEVGFARELERLAKAPVHQRNNTLNLCVFRAGQLAARGLIDHAKAKSEPARIAKSIGLGEAEIERTVESGFRAGLNSPAWISLLMGLSPRCPTRQRRLLIPIWRKNSQRWEKPTLTTPSGSQNGAGRKSSFRKAGVGWPTMAFVSGRTRIYTASSWRRK